MQRTALRNMPLAVLFLFPLALAGCASEGSVSRADTDATAAMNTANQSKSEADQALSTAQQALKTAQQASAKADRMYQRNLQK